MYSSYYVDGVFMFNLILHAAVYTAVYANDLISVFDDSDDEDGFSDSVFSNITESGFNILFSLFLLVIVSVVSGFLFKDLFIGAGNSTFHDSIFVLLNNQTYCESEYLPVGWKLLPLLTSFCISFILSSFLEDDFIDIFSRYDFFSFSYFYNIMLDFETIICLRQFLFKLGFNNVNNQKLISEQGNLDFDSLYLFNVSLSFITRLPSLIFFVFSNTRFESPLLNFRFSRLYLEYNVDFFSIGVGEVDINFPILNISTSLCSLFEIFEFKHFFCRSFYEF